MHGKYRFAAVVVPEGNFQVAHCPELGVTSQGLTVEEALANLKTAVHLYLQDDVAYPDSEERYPLLTTIEVAL